MQEVFCPFLSTLVWLSSILLYSIQCPQDPFSPISFSFTLQNMVHVFLLSAEIAHPCFQIPSYPLQSHPQTQTVWWLRYRLDDRRMEVCGADNNRDICLRPIAETGSEVQVRGESLPQWQSAWCTNSSLTPGAALTLSQKSWWRCA
jgi:hypothetical protein